MLLQSIQRPPHAPTLAKDIVHTINISTSLLKAQNKRVVDSNSYTHGGLLPLMRDVHAHDWIAVHS